MKCGSEGAAITLSIGGESSMKVALSEGNDPNSWDKCHESNDEL